MLFSSCCCFCCKYFVVVVLKVSIVTVARQNLNYSGNGFHGDSFMNCLSLHCLETVSMVTVARQHLHYIMEIVSMVIIHEVFISELF